MSIRAKVRAQTLDDEITFERSVTSKSATGAEQISWTEIVRCRARVDGAKASSPEPVVQGGVRTKRDYTVWVRADVVSRFGINPIDRVKWRQRTMNILDIPDQGLKGGLLAVICEAGLIEG